MVQRADSYKEEIKDLALSLEPSERSKMFL